MTAIPGGRERKRIKMFSGKKKIRKSVCSKRESEFLLLFHKSLSLSLARALEVKHITFKLKNRSHISLLSFGGCGVISYFAGDSHIGHMSTLKEEALSTITRRVQ